MSMSGKANFKSKVVAHAFSASCRAVGCLTEVKVIVDEEHYRVAGYRVYWSRWSTAL